MNNGQIDKPLFLPLNTFWFNEFAYGRKKWEIRGIGNQYNKKTVRIGREVTLRRGYNTNDELGGIITKIVTTTNIWDLKTEILKEAISDTLIKQPSVLKWIETYNEKYNEFIVFKIEPVGEQWR